MAMAEAAVMAVAATKADLKSIMLVGGLLINQVEERMVGG